MKNTLNIKSLFALLMVGMAFAACNKDNKFGTVDIEFEHKWGSNDFMLNQQLIHPTNGDTATFTKLRYYISNIKLTTPSGEVWAQPESYYLIDFGAGTTMITIEDVPADHYEEISYTIGVDSARNVSGAQDGALAVSNDMFWSWNSGYIFIKAEGTLPSGTSFAYHIGGFSGSSNAIQTTTTSFGSDHLVLKNKDTREMHFMVDVSKMWNNTLKLSTSNMVHMPGVDAVTASGNFKTGFSLDHIH